MVCLTQTDKRFDLGRVSAPLALAFANGSNLSLHEEGDFSTVSYHLGATGGCNEGRRVKVNYMCPSGDEVSEE